MSLPVKDFGGVGLFTAYSLKPSDSESGIASCAQMFKGQCSGVNECSMLTVQCSEPNALDHYFIANSLSIDNCQLINEATEGSIS